MKKFIIIFFISCMASLVFSTTLQNTPYEEQLIHIQFAERLGDLSVGFDDKSIELKALLLDYSDDEILLLKSRIALLKYPEKSEKVLLRYGTEPEFQKILRQYGEEVIPVIDYFYEHDDAVLELMRSAQNEFLKWTETLRKIWQGESTESDSSQIRQLDKLSPTDRGWYAVNLIAEEGYDFLGQFTLASDGTVKWIQTERVLENLNELFAGGIRNLEIKYVKDEAISARDMLWGAVDVAVIGGTLKLLRAGRVAAKTGQRLSFVRRTRLFAPRLFAGAGLVARKLATYGAAAATVYVVAANPKIIHGMMAEAANAAGFNPLAVQFTGWLLILMIVLYPLFWVIKLAIRPAISFLNLLILFIRRVEKVLSAKPEVEYGRV